MKRKMSKTNKAAEAAAAESEKSSEQWNTNAESIDITNITAQRIAVIYFPPLLM